MAGCSEHSVDLIKELRLRRWARAHYVPAQRRSSSWHPVVLEEMRRKDDELAERRERQPLAVAYVPLAPTELYRFDEPHASLPAPKLHSNILTARQSAETVECFDYLEAAG